MGCFLGCFGGEKVQKRRKQRVNRPSPQRQRNRIQNVQQEKVVTAEQLFTENHHTNLVSEVSELGNKPEVVEQRSPSPRKRVTFNSNVTTYEHVPIHESIESLPDSAANEEEKEEGLKSSSHSQSKSKDDDSITSSVGSYPPNHRYHNARESDDEAEEEEYGDSDLDDDDDEYEDEDYYSDDEEDNVRLLGHEVWSESVITASMESRTGNSSPPQEVESLMEKKTHITNARDRSVYINSVLNPVENITQWKAAKAKGGKKPLLKPQKENFATSEAPSKAKYQEIAVDASLSNWLPSESCASARSFEDRPILGALTVEEVRQISATPSPRKSPCRSPDDMPIIGSVGSFWNDSSSAKNSGSNTTSKYRLQSDGW